MYITQRYVERNYKDTHAFMYAVECGSNGDGEECWDPRDAGEEEQVS